MVHNNIYGAEYLDASELVQRVYNLPKLMSSCNRREYKNVDNQGNAQLYTVGVRAWGTDLGMTSWTAPNTYVTRRAVKAWHDARVKMFKRAGISMKSLGYGRSLRPYLNVNHENGSTREIDTESTMTGSSAMGIVPHYTGDEWTYSRASVATPMEDSIDSGDAHPHAGDFVDRYTFTLCDVSVTEGSTADDPDDSTGVSEDDSFVSVGMLKEWLGSFKKKGTRVESDENIVEDNALLQLISQQGADKEEVLELAADAQVEERPWDLGGSTHYSETCQSLSIAKSGESAYSVIQVPCGLLQLRLENNHSGAELVHYQIEVLDIQDM